MIPKKWREPAKDPAEVDLVNSCCAGVLKGNALGTNKKNWSHLCNHEANTQ